MVKVTFRSYGEADKVVDVRKGSTILRAAKQGRVGLRHKCGGRASCTTCKVTIHDQSVVSPVSAKEQRKLGEANLAKGLRLSCQTSILHTVAVEIPEDPYQARIRALLQQQPKGKFD